MGVVAEVKGVDNVCSKRSCIQLQLENTYLAIPAAEAEEHEACSREERWFQMVVVVVRVRRVTIEAREII